MLTGNRSTKSPRESHRIALGLEQIGLISLHFPQLITLALIVLCTAAAFGVERIRIDDSLSQLFRSDTPEFKQYETVTRRFPSSEYDVLVVVEGKALLDREPLDKLRNLVTNLQLIEGTRGLISLFSAREPAENGRLPEPLFPSDLPQDAEYAKLIDRVKQNELVKGKLLSLDGQLALIVLALDPSAVDGHRLREIIGEIRQTVGDDLADSGLTTQLSGVPVMQLEIRNAVERDRLVYNAAGFVMGCLIAILFFRRTSFMVMASAPPLIAILLSLGTLGWLDFQLNMFLNVMTPLIMVISFADSMQLTFAARDWMLRGKSKAGALKSAILVVGPACVLTHATAGVSFIALQFSKSDLIRAFGEAGLLATLIALVSVLALVPLFGILLVRDDTDIVEMSASTDSGVNALRRLCAWIAARMVARPGLYSAISLLLVGGLALIYASLEPRYRLADQVPDRDQAVQASNRLDAKLAGANPIDVLIEFPEDRGLYAPETLDTIAAVHTVLEQHAGVGNVWSLETLRRWLAEKAGKSDTATLRQYVDALPQFLVRRFIDSSQDAVVVSGRIPDIDANQLLPIANTLDEKLNAIRTAHPGYNIATTGLAMVAARNSANMIGKLSAGLTIEVAFIAIFLGLAFRSVVVALVTILPAIFPIVLSGTLLWILGEGLQFASIVALIVSFGLGLSATIHFLNRLRLEQNPGEDPGAVVQRATVLVGPALILTSVVLACGLAMTVFSDLPSLRLFGWLSAFAMLAALIADLTILRPTAMFLYQLSGGRRRLWLQRFRAP